ncbi:MAG: protein kinase [Pirellulaceae bacterium]
MSHEPLSRQLLFGFIAFQHGLLDKTRFLSAIDQWLRDKSVDLQALFRSLGNLNTEEVELLNRLVDLHLRRHGDDVAASLTALGGVDELLGELTQRSDPDLSVTIPGLASGTHGDRGQAVFLTHRGGTSRFHIVRPHARGGLGEVFLAQDSELNRQVALKEIQECFADNPESRRRFVVEAEVTGGLEHPGIVPVYGLGQYDNGRPYYAMRFIRGTSLRDAVDAFHRGERRPLSDPLAPTELDSSTVDAKLSETRTELAEETGWRSVDMETTPVDWVEKPARPAATARTVGDAPISFQSVEFRQLLGAFTDVCNAIEYAHSRGVLHRDIKPANIMLGRYGETLVVDWGLAKLRADGEAASSLDEPKLVASSGSGSAPTQTGSVVGTPAFMSPEQAAGKVDGIDTTADVYSLGATLYYVLTGRPPFSGETISELLIRVRAGKLRPPRAVRRNVPRALEAICLRAMALRPRDRYASCRELAQDIDRYLADEPTVAFSEPWVLRARRWSRKHPRSLAALAATVLVGLTSAIAISAIVADKNRELQGKNEELTQRGIELLAANEREVEARKEAEANELAARQQSQLALTTLSSVIRDIQGGLKGTAGGGEIRRRLLRTSLDSLSLLATEFVDETSVERSTWIALNDMANVISRFGIDADDAVLERRLVEQFSDEQQSAVELARMFHQRALEIAERLADQDPDNLRLQRDIAISHDLLGHADLLLGRLDEALRHFEQGLEIRQSLSDRYIDEADRDRDLGDSYFYLGRAQLWLGDSSAALTYWEESLAAWQRLQATAPDDPVIRSNLALAYEVLGEAQRQVGATSRAKESAEASLAIHLELVAEAGADVGRRMSLLRAWEDVSEMQQQFGEIVNARESAEAGLEIMRELSAADPSDEDIQERLASALARLADVQSRAARPRAGELSGLPGDSSTVGGSRSVQSKLATQPSDRAR